MKRASCGLLYGAMNTTKTTNLGRIARYLHTKYGLRSRLISADNEHDTLDDLITQGIIEVLDIAAIQNPFAMLVKLSRGFWPRLQNGKLVMAETLPEEFAKIGAYLIEGTTTIAELLHQDHIRKGRAIGEELVGKFDDSVETAQGTERITLAKSARAHYQQVQDFVTLDLIPTFSMLPVRWVWWTGHEYAGEDEATGQTRLGPGVVGKAATMKVPRKMGNTFHLVTYENIQTDPRTHKSTRETEYRAYFEPHADAQLTRLFWPAGVKLPVEAVPAWRAKFPEGYIPLTLTEGVEQFLAFHDSLSKLEGARQVEAGQTSGEIATPKPASPKPATPAPPKWRPRITDSRLRAVAPTLTQQLEKSIVQVQDAKQNAALAAVADANEVPSINDIPVETTKGE